MAKTATKLADGSAGIADYDGLAHCPTMDQDCWSFVDARLGGGVGCLIYWLTMLSRPRGPEGDCQWARHPSEK